MSTLQQVRDAKAVAGDLLKRHGVEAAVGIGLPSAEKGATGYKLAIRIRRAPTFTTAPEEPASIVQSILNAPDAPKAVRGIDTDIAVVRNVRANAAAATA